VKLQQAKRQREAVAEIEKLGGGVYYDWQCDKNIHVPDFYAKMPTSHWLRSLFGDDLFQSANVVTLTGTKVTDAELEHLKGLSQLQELYLLCTKVTDAGMERLTGLSQLQWLWLGGTKVTDAGLEHLKGLSQLQRLDLRNTQVTDAGLEHLKGLSHLRLLHLDDTQVTDAGIKKLHQALPNCTISWFGSP
jgi:hypothetical protein